MMTPTYREIVLTFSSLSALVGRMMNRGGVKLTLTIECDEDEIEQVRRLAKLEGGATKIMGISLAWRPKS